MPWVAAYSGGGGENPCGLVDFVGADGGELGAQLAGG